MRARHGCWDKPDSTKELLRWTAKAVHIGSEEVCEMLRVTGTQTEGVRRYSYSNPRGSLETLKEKPFCPGPQSWWRPWDEKDQKPGLWTPIQKPESISFKLYDSPDSCHSLAVWHGANFLIYYKLCCFSDLVSRWWICVVSWTHALSLCIWSFSY